MEKWLINNLQLGLRQYNSKSEMGITWDIGTDYAYCKKEYFDLNWYIFVVNEGDHLLLRYDRQEPISKIGSLGRYSSVEEAYDRLLKDIEKLKYFGYLSDNLTLFSKEDEYKTEEFCWKILKG